MARYLSIHREYEAITFDELVAHGFNETTPANLVNGLPWSFSYAGYPVTHENDNLYLIMIPGRPDAVRFHRGEILLTSPNGRIYVCDPRFFNDSFVRDGTSGDNGSVK